MSIFFLLFLLLFLIVAIDDSFSFTCNVLILFLSLFLLNLDIIFSVNFLHGIYGLAILILGFFLTFLSFESIGSGDLLPLLYFFFLSKQKLIFILCLCLFTILHWDINNSKSPMLLPLLASQIFLMNIYR